MPVLAITYQPQSDSLNAAYRPIIFRVKAQLPNSTTDKYIPPVIYCDVYLDGIFYETFTRTMFIYNNGTSPEYEFDIQDALQEVMGYNLPTIDGKFIERHTRTIKKVYVKFRNAYLDSNGFTLSEQKEPVQGTLSTLPVPGEGTQSNSFFVLNSTIQHEEKPNLETLLSSYKTDKWESTTFPLTKRPQNIFMRKNDSSYFPITTDESPDYYCVEAVYRDGSIHTECSKIEELIIDAGPDQTVEFETPGQSKLNVVGTITGGTPASFIWEVVQKPFGSNPIIDNINSLLTKLLVDVFGLYTLRLSVTNNKGMLFEDEVQYNIIKKSEPVCNPLTNINTTKGNDYITCSWIAPVGVNQCKAGLYNSNNQLISEQNVIINSDRTCSVTFSGLAEKTSYIIKVSRLCSTTWIDSISETVTTNPKPVEPEKPSIISECGGTAVASCCFTINSGGGTKRLLAKIGVNTNLARQAKLVVSGSGIYKELVVDGVGKDGVDYIYIEVVESIYLCIMLTTTPGGGGTSSSSGFFEIENVGVVTVHVI